MATDSDQCSGNTTKAGRVVFIPRRRRPTVRRPYADGGRQSTQTKLSPLDRGSRTSVGVTAAVCMASLIVFYVVLMTGLMLSGLVAPPRVVSVRPSSSVPLR